MSHTQTDPASKAVKALLEGFSRRVLADYLAPITLPPHLLVHIERIIESSGARAVFVAETTGTPCDESLRSCLVDGPQRSIALGRGRTVETFVEGEEERLVFFPKPGQAAPVTLRVEAWVDNAAAPVQAMLTRDAQYHYLLEGQHIHALASTWEQAEFEVMQRGTGPCARVTLRPCAIWPFVFGPTTDPQALFRAQICPAHVAALLGLSMLTVSRRIGEGKLPAVRSRSTHPGIELAGLFEYLAYRRQFPQGHPNLRRIEAWQRGWRQTYRTALGAMLPSDSAGGPDFRAPQESVPR